MHLTEEVARLKAIQEEERVKWERRIAQSEAENVTLKVNVNLFLVSIIRMFIVYIVLCVCMKHSLESGKKEWALKLAEIDKTIISMRVR